MVANVSLDMDQVHDYDSKCKNQDLHILCWKSKWELLKIWFSKLKLY